VAKFLKPLSGVARKCQKDTKKKLGDCGALVSAAQKV
jgi:hypothetical protein